MEVERLIRVNGEARAFEEGSVADVLRRLGHAPARPGIAVALNGEVVPRSEWEQRRIRPGDDVEVVGAVQGG